jgi:HAD superfamily hydrolase (TIGR01509 family)
MYRNLIWDLDGTLFNTYPAIASAFRAALCEFGRDAALDQVEKLARRSISECIAALAKDSHLDVVRFETAYLARYARISLKEQHPMPGVGDLCRMVCANGGRNVIVTHRERTSSEALLTTHNLADYFSGCISSDDGYPRKPDAAMMYAALKLHNLERTVTLAIGDREIDIMAGQAAGLATCLYGSPSDETAAEYHISSYVELLPLFTRFGGPLDK